jgi:hypothetical protein
VRDALFICGSGFSRDALCWSIESMSFRSPAALESLSLCVATQRESNSPSEGGRKLLLQRYSWVSQNDIWGQSRSAKSGHLYAL